MQVTVSTAFQVFTKFASLVNFLTLHGLFSFANLAYIEVYHVDMQTLQDLYHTVGFHTNAVFLSHLCMLIRRNLDTLC